MITVHLETPNIINMKFYLVFAAVLLSAVSAKVTSMPEEASTKAPSVPVPIEAHVVEVPKDHVEPMSVVDKMPATNPVEVVKVPLSPSPQVPQTNGDDKKSEMLVDAKQPVVETTKVPEVTQLVPVPSLVLQTPEVSAVPVPTVVTTTAPKDASMINDPKLCDILCTKFELNPICAVSAACVHEFPNQCTMDTYNCLHPDKTFKEVKDDRCKMHWLNHCTEKEMQM